MKNINSSDEEQVTQFVFASLSKLLGCRRYNIKSKLNLLLCEDKESYEWQLEADVFNSTNRTYILSGSVSSNKTHISLNKITFDRAVPEMHRYNEGYFIIVDDCSVEIIGQSKIKKFKYDV